MTAHSSPPPRFVFNFVIWLTAMWDWVRDLISPTPVRLVDKLMGFMQSEVLGSLDRVGTTLDENDQTVNAILKLEGYKTIDELVKDLDNILTAEQLALWKSALENIAGQNAITDKITKYASIVAKVADKVGASGMLRKSP